MVRAWPGLKGHQVTGYEKEKKINQGHPFVRTQDGFQCEGGRHALAGLLTCWGASWQSLNLTTASALRLHFLLRWLALRPQRSRSPLSRRARIVGGGNEGAWRAGCVLSLSWWKKKKGKQLNLFPVFITNIDLGIREEQLQTFCGRNILGNLRSVHLARHGVSRGPARPRLIYRVSARRVAYSNRDFVALHFYAVHFQHCLRGLGFICKLNICQTLQSHTA